MIDLTDFEMPKDSLDMIDFIGDLEDQFDILIYDSEIADVHNKEDIIALVERKVNEKR